MKTWARETLSEMRRTHSPARMVARLRQSQFGIHDGDTITMEPVTDQWSDAAPLVLIGGRGRARICQVATRKGPHPIGARLQFMDAAGRHFWAGPREQLAVVRRVA